LPTKFVNILNISIYLRGQIYTASVEISFIIIVWVWTEGTVF